jgi:hypothetical protein
MGIESFSAALNKLRFKKKKSQNGHSLGRVANHLPSRAI